MAGRLGIVGDKSVVNIFAGKTFLYCEPHKRIKEVLEEELSIKRDECHVKSTPAGNLSHKEVCLLNEYEFVYLMATCLLYL